MTLSPEAPEQRLLMRAATAKDAVMAAEVLHRAHIDTRACADLPELIVALGRGAGALVLAEECSLEPSFSDLAAALAKQPPWSDIPVIVLARQGADSRAIARMMDELSNVTVIERPMRVASLVSAARSALRARRRQYELRKVLADLQESDQRKTEFLATLAHELRNPLAPISTAVALLSRKSPTPVEAARLHAVMQRQIDHMVRLINDLMEVSRITRNKIDMQRVPVSLEQVISDAVELSRPQLESAGHQLRMSAVDETYAVRGDPVRLTQVFSNLLNNAAKYTPHGGQVTLEVRRERRDVVVNIRDTGIGLAPNMLQPIFEMFVQVTGTSRAAQGGLGIGLTLVKSLVELHGGSVEAHSDGLGQGSTFTVRLPLMREVALDQVEPLAPIDSNMLSADRHILVVDDNRDAADSLRDLLGAVGATTWSAYNGEEALAVATRHRIDIAVLDIGMPGMDGCDLARALRKQPGGGDMTLIALTGWGQPEDRQRIAAAGFDHHLLKPVNAEELMNLI